jgi:hypothetical protein
MLIMGCTSLSRFCVHPEAAPVWRGVLRQTRGPDPGTGSPSAGFSRQEEIFAILQRLRDVLRPCVSTPMAHKAQFSLRETRWMTRAGIHMGAVMGLL